MGKKRRKQESKKESKENICEKKAQQQQAYDMPLWAKVIIMIVLISQIGCCVYIQFHRKDSMILWSVQNMYTFDYSVKYTEVDKTGVKDIYYVADYYGNAIKRGEYFTFNKTLEGGNEEFTNKYYYNGLNNSTIESEEICTLCTEAILPINKEGLDTVKNIKVDGDLYIAQGDIKDTDKYSNIVYEIRLDKKIGKIKSLKGHGEIKTDNPDDVTKTFEFEISTIEDI